MVHIFLDLSEKFLVMKSENASLLLASRSVVPIKPQTCIWEVIGSSLNRLPSIPTFHDFPQSVDENARIEPYMTLLSSSKSVPIQHY